MTVASVVISLISLFLSITTGWLTLLRRGRLAMTKPSVLFLGFDFEPEVTPKIFLRTLLYSTASRGQVVEGMFARVLSERSERVFSFWGYGEREHLAPGSGIYVGQNGVAANHHFLVPPGQRPFHFEAGDYSIEVYARVVGRRQPQKLSTMSLRVLSEHAACLAQSHGVLFELNATGKRYYGHVRQPPH